jgi:hypothetical protein
MNDETEGCRRLHNAEFYGFYCSPDIILLIKLLRMRWVGHVVLMGDRTDRTVTCTVLVGIIYLKASHLCPKRRWENIIKMYLYLWTVEAWTGLIRPGTETGVRQCECGN